MAELTVRDLEEEIVRLLRARAGEEGISVEEAHRKLLRSALVERPTGKIPSFKDYLLEMPDIGDDSVFERPRALPREVDLD